ncbi:MAG: membrane dipeptidase [Planctomycetia bacterium]|nr:membrane dipeptidase [Planctomycetia bacterium]
MDRRAFLGASMALPLVGAAVVEAGDDKKNTAIEPAAVRENPYIRHCRDVALGILKPSERELQRGLELHANSLVFDVYGFAPRAAVDGDAVKSAVDAGASETELQDLTEDMSMTRCVSDPAERDEFLHAWQAAGVTCIFQNAGEEGQGPLRLLKRLARFTYVTDMLRERVSKAVTPDDIVEAKKQQRLCLYLTGNGVPLVQDWLSVADELRYLRVFFQLGIRMMHLTYQRRNTIGDGAAEPANAGLSDFGRAVIAEMNRLGIIVDVAHSGWQTSFEAARASKKPMVASHTSCAALHKHIRGKPDDVGRAIAEAGGLVGICCIPQFLGKSGDIAAFLDHIAHAVKHFGIDHVAIGTDIAYTSRNADAENKKIPPRPKSRTRWEALWPTETFITTPAARESLAWTNWPLFTVGLVQRGFSDADIQKILGGNMLRVARDVLK